MRRLEADLQEGEEGEKGKSRDVAGESDFLTLRLSTYTFSMGESLPSVLTLYTWDIIVALPFLPVRQDFHPKRNQARQKLATLPKNRFRDLASDVFFELRRRFPEFDVEWERERAQDEEIVMGVGLTEFIGLRSGEGSIC